MDDAEPIKQGGTAEAEPFVPGGRKARAVSGDRQLAISRQQDDGVLKGGATRCLAQYAQSSPSLGHVIDARVTMRSSIIVSDPFFRRPGALPEAAGRLPESIARTRR
jgi:hypothetical protein